MHFKRRNVLKTLLKRNTRRFSSDLRDVEYKENVLCQEKLLKKLPFKFKKQFQDILENDSQITEEIADIIANIFKEWALSKKVYHFTHWFQPLHGEIAQKSQNFLEITKKCKINALCKDSLIKQETDGSSFPNGGLRSTFEARGYIIWDFKSPVFLLDKSLCIPSTLISYKEESLDYKTPLLKANKLVETAALKIVKLLIPETKNVKSYLGWEQEFFIFDKSVLLARQDLEICGRAIIGRKGYKNQETTNHYFGKVPIRVLDFMTDVEKCAYGLGIPLKTRHNEVAPNQFEFSYFYDETPVAIDHNQLFMEIMRQKAQKHNLTVNFHEKPFKYFNGSGKHCNFSLETDRGFNLYKRSDIASENLLFLCFLSVTISAIHKYGPLLNESISSYDNDLRLGGHEAPPNILSVFVGNDLQEFLINRVKESQKKILTSMTHLPNITLDSHDRNRTSPFAYNGNRFEYRSVGSSANCSEAMTVLFTVLGNEMMEFYEEVTKNSVKGKLEDILIELTTKRIQESKNILFTGDGYSKEWRIEAQNRKLAMFKNCPDSIQQVVERNLADVFSRNNILAKNEIKARYDIKLANYINKAKLERSIIIDFLNQNVLPTAEKYLYKMIKFNEKVSFDSVENKIKILRGLVNELYSLESLLRYKYDMKHISDPVHIAQQVIPLFEKIQLICEDIETYIPDLEWTLLKNDEILHY